MTREAKTLLHIGTLSVRLNFDLITESTNAPKKVRTRTRSSRLSVDDVWFDLPDEAIEEDVKPDVEELPTTELRFAFLKSRDQMTLWAIAVVVLSCCLLGNRVLQTDSLQSPRLNVLQVNLNTASWEELQLLEGIGELTAEKIIADRAANGPYATLDDLQRVSGIGPKTLENLRPFIVCSD